MNTIYKQGSVTVCIYIYIMYDRHVSTYMCYVYVRAVCSGVARLNKLVLHNLNLLTLVFDCIIRIEYCKWLILYLSSSLLPTISLHYAHHWLNNSTNGTVWSCMIIAVKIHNVLKGHVWITKVLILSTLSH